MVKVIVSRSSPADGNSVPSPSVTWEYPDSVDGPGCAEETNSTSAYGVRDMVVNSMNALPLGGRKRIVNGGAPPVILHENRVSVPEGMCAPFAGAV